MLIKPICGTSLVDQWLRLCASTAESLSSIPSRGTKFSHAMWGTPLPKKSKLLTFLCPLLGEKDGHREVRRGPPSLKLRRPPPVPGLLPVHPLVMAAHGHGRVRAQQVLVLLPAAAHRLGDGLIRHRLRAHCLQKLRGSGEEVTKNPPPSTTIWVHIRNSNEMAQIQLR